MLNGQDSVVVNLKPIKKMKKRKERDALFRKRSSGHELLQNEETDSDTEEFSIASHSRFPKGSDGSHATCCKRFFLVFGFVALIACISVSAGLVIMHSQMKDQIAALQTRLTLVEQTASSGGSDISKVTSQINLLQKQIKQPAEQLNQLSETVERLDSSVTALKNTPTSVSSESVQKLQQNLADLGSSVQHLSDEIKVIKDTQDKLQTVQSELKSKLLPQDEEGGRETSGRKQDDSADMSVLKQQLLQLNNSFHVLQSAVNSGDLLRNITQSTQQLEKSVTDSVQAAVDGVLTQHTTQLNNELKYINSSINGLWTSWTKTQNQVTDLDHQVTALSNLVHYDRSTTDSGLLGRNDGHLPPNLTLPPTPSGESTQPQLQESTHLSENNPAQSSNGQSQPSNGQEQANNGELQPNNGQSGPVSPTTSALPVGSVAGGEA